MHLIKTEGKFSISLIDKNHITNEQSFFPSVYNCQFENSMPSDGQDINNVVPLGLSFSRFYS